MCCLAERKGNKGIFMGGGRGRVGAIENLEAWLQHKACALEWDRIKKDG